MKNSRQDDALRRGRLVGLRLPVFASPKIWDRHPWQQQTTRIMNLSSPQVQFILHYPDRSPSEPNPAPENQR